MVGGTLWESDGISQEDGEGQLGIDGTQLTDGESKRRVGEQPLMVGDKSPEVGDISPVVCVQRWSSSGRVSWKLVLYSFVVVLEG